MVSSFASPDIRVVGRNHGAAKELETALRRGGLKVDYTLAPSGSPAMQEFEARTRPSLLWMIDPVMPYDEDLAVSFAGTSGDSPEQVERVAVLIGEWLVATSPSAVREVPIYGPRMERLRVVRAADSDEG